MGSRDPYDWSRTTIDNRLEQASAQQDRTLAKSASVVESSGSPRHRYVLTAAMLFFGALLLGMSDLSERRGDSAYQGLRAAGWILWLASVFVARPKGWRIPLYLVLTYFLVGMGSFGMYPLASVALNPQSISSECRGWNGYIAQLGPIIDSINARDTLVSGGNRLPDRSLQNAITETEDIVRRLEELDPPGAMGAYHENLLGMQYKWTDVYRAGINGDPNEGMLLDLHDDWVLSSHLRDDGNDKCAGD